MDNRIGILEPMERSEISSHDLVWAAGFLEGEGSFNGSNVTAVQVQLEPLERLQKYFGGNIRLAPNSNLQPNQKPYSRWSINGQKARWLMSILYGLMSPKRQEQISTQLAKPGYWDFYCRHGHPKIKENLVARRDGQCGTRCKICQQDYIQRYHARKRITS